MAGNLPTIGVLALQGAFAKHCEKLAQLGVEPQEVRKPEHLHGCSGLIIPGGESTTIRQQLEFYDFFPELPRFANHFPLLGTCAGLILMAKELAGETPCLSLLDISVERNAYGRQTESFRTELTLDDGESLPATFIRAPRIERWTPEVTVLASHQGYPVLIRQGHHLAASFHPELTDDCTVHELFLELTRAERQ